MPMSANEAADRVAITDKIHRYCRSVDRLDIALGHAVFHADSTATFPSYEGSGRGWIDYICEKHLVYLQHSHQVTSIIIDLDGDQAGSEAYYTASLRQRDGDQIFQRTFWGRYLDRWSRRDGEWAIDVRDCVVDFDDIRPVTPIRDNLVGRRDRDDPSYRVLG